MMHTSTDIEVWRKARVVLVNRKKISPILKDENIDHIFTPYNFIAWKLSKREKAQRQYQIKMGKLKTNRCNQYDCHAYQLSDSQYCEDHDPYFVPERKQPDYRLLCFDHILNQPKLKRISDFFTDNNIDEAGEEQWLEQYSQYQDYLKF